MGHRAGHVGGGRPAGRPSRWRRHRRPHPEPTGGAHTGRVSSGGRRVTSAGGNRCAGRGGADAGCGQSDACTKGRRAGRAGGGSGGDCRCGRRWEHSSLYQRASFRRLPATAMAIGDSGRRAGGCPAGGHAVAGRQGPAPPVLTDSRHRELGWHGKPFDKIRENGKLSLRSW